MLSLLLVACTEIPPEAPAAPVPVDAWPAAMAFDATRPLYERPLGDGRAGLPGVADLSAESCAACHAEIAAEWRTSVHAVAWIDPQYQAEIGKSGNRWLCLNCHTPLKVQQDRFAVALEDGDVERPVLVDNPDFDAALREEGITCAACHVRDGVVHGPGLGGNAPHPVKADPTYRSGELCLRCHQATATYPGKSFICVFDTGREWRDGPYDDEGKSCVTCHMPTVERPAALGGPTRTVARHWWRGAGIPKIAGRYPPPEANPFGLSLAAAVEGGELKVTATNANAGHMLPTGDPERKVFVDAVFLGSSGDEVGRKRWTFGQEWTWTPPTRHADDRLAPRESRVLAVPVPDGAVRAVVSGTNERMSEQNRAYHHLEGYPIQAETQRLEVAIP